MWIVGLTLFLLQAANAAPAPVPAQERLTELDQLRMENVQLQDRLAKAYADGDLCRVELAPYRRLENTESVKRARAKLKADIEAAHPGFTFNVEAGTLEKRPAGAGKPLPE